MTYKVYKPVLAWLSVLLLLLLAACGGGAGPDFSNQEGVEVNIFAGLGSTSSSSSVETSEIDTQGVPSNPETGETGVDSAELEVFSGDTQLFFSDGRIVDEGEGEAVTLTPDDSDVSLFLPQGSYRFALTALDDQGNVLAQGETEQQVDEDSRVSIPLVSLIGSARFEVPKSIKGNQVFDAFVRVSPPGREDLEVALGDFSVTYDVQEPSVQLEGSSNIGVRIAAACDVVEVTATIDNDLSDTVTANATIPVNDPTCEGTGTDVGTDLVPPYVSINTPQADATLNKSFTLQGDVNDQQSGIDKVEVYEGTVKLGDATVDTDNRSWSFDASLDDGSYTLIAVAFDKAGNSSRAEVNVTVEEGSGSEVENCTSPVEIPDEVLRAELKRIFGLSENDNITCENLASLREFDYDVGDSFLPSISDLEGLQYALNLRSFRLSNNALTPESLAPLGALTSLETLDFSVNVENDSALSFLETLVNLKSLSVEPGSIPSDLEDYVGPTLNLSPLQNLTKLEKLSLFYFTLNDLNPLQGLTELTDLRLGNDNISDIKPLANLTNLESLYLSGNEISDISTVQSFTKLASFEATSNRISDLSALQNLNNLASLSLSSNEISRLDALVANEGLAEGDEIDLFNNPLETCPATEGRADIDTLIGRGVDMTFDEPENCNGEGGNGGDDDNAQTCANPVNIPDEGLRQAILLYLRSDDAESGTITCENLARLFELRLDPLDSGFVNNLEGLQYAVNLKEFFTNDVTFSADELAPIRNLTNLKKLDLTLLENEEDNFSFLENLSGLESLSLSSLASERLEEDVVRPTVDLSQLQNLANLKGLSLDSFTLNDLSPLVNNTGLGEGDRVNFINSSLETCPGTDGRANIDSLIERGVEVNFNEPESCQN